MKRYLLFDSHCSVCTTLARNIERESGGWLLARSLRDLDMQAILNRTHPHWRFEPTLVEINDNKARVYTGIAMRMRIIGGLGPLRAWRISEIVRQAVISKDNENLSRRKFLRRTGAFLTGLTLIGGAVTPRAQATRTAATVPCTDGEEYAGFLLLSEGTPIPACVNDEGLGIPNMCGVSDDSKERSLKIETIHIPLDGVSDLAARKVFSPFTIDPVPTGLVPSGATLIQRNTGEFWGGWVSFERFSEKLQLSYTTLSILAQIDFMRPMPLWASKAVEEGGPSTILEKVDYVPNGAGVLIRNGVGFTLHWIQKNVYYMLTVNHLPGADPMEIASRIKQVI